eukprot:12278781-Alexandrium_andersonii.AAC.1
MHNDGRTPLDTTTEGQQLVSIGELCHLSLGIAESFLQHNDVPLLKSVELINQSFKVGIRHSANIPRSNAPTIQVRILGSFEFRAKII